jgi:hypothetical protein
VLTRCRKRDEALASRGYGGQKARCTEEITYKP